MKIIGKYKAPLLIWLIFEAIAVALWLLQGSIFYFFNFTYIGTAIATGLLLYTLGYMHARMLIQLSVGLYMLVYLGIVCRENMQIEGFWYYLFSGVLQAAVIHYLVAKVAGPVLFGRGWCGYACWTAMVLDFLPYKIPKKPRQERLGLLRFMVFILSLVYVIFLFSFFHGDLEHIMFVSFMAGNITYYVVGIVLAFCFKDNRAFCKYMCPITVFLKPASFFSLIRVKVNPKICTLCGRCKKICPMDVDMLDNSRLRKNGTECILCYECVKVCPNKALG